MVAALWEVRELAGMEFGGVVVTLGVAFVIIIVISQSRDILSFLGNAHLMPIHSDSGAIGIEDVM